MKEIISLMFIGGTLLFLFGAMILEKKIMWFGVVFCAVMMIYFAVADFSKPQTTEDKSS